MKFFSILSTKHHFLNESLISPTDPLLDKSAQKPLYKLNVADPENSKLSIDECLKDLLDNGQRADARYKVGGAFTKEECATMLKARRIRANLGTRAGAGYCRNQGLSLHEALATLGFRPRQWLLVRGYDY